MNLASFATGVAIVGLCSLAALSWEDERGRICQPGFAASQRLYGDAYRRLRDGAFARAGVPTYQQCHHGNEGSGSKGGDGPECQILDHIVPLCLDGANDLGNLQLQPWAEAHAKDRKEA